MIGVVLWCDIAESQAVIWSEGPEGLCYFDGVSAGVFSGDMFEVGDVVQFDVRIARNVRVARNVKRLLDNWTGGSGSALDTLPEEATGTHGFDGAEILPFCHTTPGTRRRKEQEPRRKLG